VLPAGFRRPPAEPARQPLPGGFTRPSARPASRTPELPVKDVQYDREIAAAITAGDPAAIARAYDRYAASLYGYCHWILHDRAATAGALTDTFVIAAATLGKLPDPAKLRPWLFALARNECQRRIRPGTVARNEEADAVGEAADAGDELPDATSDETVQFRAVGWPSAVADATSDETVQFGAVGWPRPVADATSDETVQFGAVGRPRPVADATPDETVQFRVISLPVDPVTPFHVISQPTHGLGQLGSDQGQAELRSLIHSVLAGLGPREREVIELVFRHHLDGGDLAIALGVSQSKADKLASRARGRLEEALGALHIALTGRGACPELGKLLADWDGQLTEQTRDLVVWHVGECQTCAHRGWGAMRPAAFSRLLPLAQLPRELRDQVLGVCNSTAEDAVTYRRRIARHAESIWFARFSRAIRRASWSNIRANPGAAVAAAAVAMWIVAAVSVALLTFTGSRTADAHAARTDAGTGSRGPGGAVATTAAPAHSAPTHAARRPSPTATRPAAHLPAPVRSVSARAASSSPAPSRSASSSPSPSPSPSRTASPSPSPSPSSASPSPSPSSTSPPAARVR
jgi:RNA polymerase sigma factor (sigma-70 family)